MPSSQHVASSALQDYMSIELDWME